MPLILKNLLQNPKLLGKSLGLYLKDFIPKIIAIEEVKDIDQIPLTELVGNLQTYEMRLGLIGKRWKE